MIYINGSPLNVTMFPDQTSQVWNVPQLEIPNTNWVHVMWEFSHEGEFMQLAQLRDLLGQYGFMSTLRIKYLPYGRQDKVVSNKTTFALHTFSKLLNSLHFEEVIIHDPHSNLALELIRNSKAQYPEKELEKVAMLTDCGTICYPDKGAVEKYSKVYPWVYVYGEKVRDQATGRITKYEIRNEFWKSVRNERVLIVDDICDGGATFVLLAKELRERGATNVDLFVTHGLFTKGLKPLFDAGINRIFTQAGEASEIQGHIAYEKMR
jgi:ribose-phosphate pyrophosphokinase